MAKIECWYKQDRKKPVKVQAMNGAVFTLDNVGSLIGVEIYENGVPVDLTGSVNGYIILPDDTTVSVAGTRSGNKASINLPQSALAIPGIIKIAIKLTNSNEITTVLAVVATVARSRTDTIITPSSQIITDWSQQIAAEMQAVEDASAAQDAKISDLKTAFIQDFRKLTAVESGSDLDNFVLPGNYSVVSGSVAEQVENIPEESVGMLSVIQYNEHAYGQIYIAITGNVYRRNAITSAMVWSKWERDARADAYNGNYRNIDAIEQNADLNDFTMSRNYAILTGEIARTLANRPCDAAGHLYVYAINSNVLMQMYFGYTGYVYIRSCTSGTWTDWIPVNNDTTIAEMFSASVSYRAGQYVIVSDENHVNNLYRFLTNHDAGAWVGTDAVKIKLSNDISDLKNDCSVLDDEIDDVRPFEPYIEVVAEVEPGTLKTNGENGSSTNANRRSAKWIKNKPVTSISVIGGGASFTIVVYGKMTDGTVEQISRITTTYHALVDVPAKYDSFRFVVTSNNVSINVYRSNDAKKKPVNTVYQLPLIPTDQLSDGQFVDCSAFTRPRAVSAAYFKPYKNTTLSIHTEQASTSLLIYKYSTSCVFIESVSGSFDSDLELDDGYLYRFVFYNSNGVDTNAEVTIKNKIYRRLELNFVYGSMTGSGAYVENPSIPTYVCRDGITTHSEEVLFVKVKDGYDAIVNALQVDGSRSNVVLYDDFSITGNKILLGFRRRDEGEITGDHSDVLKVYSVKRASDSKTGYDWTVAAPNSFGRHKLMADIVCEDIGKEFNTQFVLQCCINQIDSPCSKVYLYPGDYELDNIKENPVAKYGKDCFGVTHSLTTASGEEKTFSTDVSPDRSFGTRVCLCIASPYATSMNRRKIVQIDGYTMGEPQDGRLSTARIRLVESLWDNLSENDDQVSILCFEGNRSTDTYAAKALLHMSNIDFYGKDAVKPVVFIDAYYVHNVRIVDVNVYARGYAPFEDNQYGNSFAPFTAMPNRKNVGFRLSQGDPYGRSKVEGCHATGLGVGFDMTSEHYIFENCHASRCKWGFCFGDYNGRESTQHNILMLKCSISQCMKSIRFNRFGYDEGVLSTDPQFEDEFFNVVRTNKLKGHQTIQIVDLSMGEPSFLAEGFIGDDGTEYVSGVHYPTEGFHEVDHGYISWMGKITVQKGRIVSKGCKGFEIRNLDNVYSGSLSDMPTSFNNSPVYNGTEFIDIDNHDVYKFFQNGTGQYPHWGTWIKLLKEEQT